MKTSQSHYGNQTEVLLELRYLMSLKEKVNYFFKNCALACIVAMFRLMRVCKHIDNGKKSMLVKNKEYANINKTF